MSTLFEQQIRKFLVHTIAEVRSPVYTSSGVDYPNVTSTNVPCRFEPSQRLIRTDDGREILLQGNVYVGPNVEVQPDTKLVINGQEYLVFRSKRSVDDLGDTILKRLEVK